MATKRIKGYKYSNRQDAVAARNSINASKGIPVSEDSVTKNWTNFEEAFLDKPIFWYIKTKDSLVADLGAPQYFDKKNIAFGKEFLSTDIEGVCGTPRFTYSHNGRWILPTIGDICLNEDGRLLSSGIRSFTDGRGSVKYDIQGRDGMVTRISACKRK
jgi:hypothetical protein